MSLQICCIAPNIFGFTGGIQTYTINLLQALQALLPDAEYITLLKYDRPEDIRASSLSFPDIRFIGLGQWPRPVQTVAMLAALLWLAARYPHMCFIATHANYAKALYVAKRFFGIRYWVVAHGIEVWNIQNRILQKALHHADCIAAVSQYTRQRLIAEQNLAPEQITVLTNTIDGDRFQIQPKSLELMQRHGLRSNQPIILTVCRLGKSGTYKGYEQIVRALPQIQAHISDVHLVLVGKGDDLPRLRQLVTDCHLDAYVTFAGFVPDAELPAYYQLCDVFAMPSTGEGFGIVYLEALACGKPVLAGDRDGAVDPLLQGELGCLVNPHDLEAIATALTQILLGQYPNRNLYCPRYLRERAIAHFSSTTLRQQLACLLQHQKMMIYPQDSGSSCTPTHKPMNSCLTVMCSIFRDTGRGSRR